MRLTNVLFGLLLLCVANLFASPFAHAQSTNASPAPARSISIAGIVEGDVALIRQTTRYTLAEGVLLNDQDIIETAPGAFAQIELPGGVLLGLLQGGVDQAQRVQPLALAALHGLAQLALDLFGQRHGHRVAITASPAASTPSTSASRPRTPPVTRNGV